MRCRKFAKLEKKKKQQEVNIGGVLDHLSYDREKDKMPSACLFTQLSEQVLSEPFGEYSHNLVTVMWKLNASLINFNQNISEHLTTKESKL